MYCGGVLNNPHLGRRWAEQKSFKISVWYDTCIILTLKYDYQTHAVIQIPKDDIFDECNVKIFFVQKRSKS